MPASHPEPRLAALLAAALTLLAACSGGGGHPRTPDAGPLPPGTQPIAASARLTAPRPTERCYSPPVRMVFHSKQEWDGYWFQATRKCPPPAVPAGVDFGREMLVYAAMGRRIAPQDSISIDGTGVRNDSLIVAVRRYMLMDGCGGRPVATYPQSLVKVPADTFPYRFSEVHIKIPCGQGES